MKNITSMPKCSYFGPKKSSKNIKTLFSYKHCSLGGVISCDKFWEGFTAMNSSVEAASNLTDCKVDFNCLIFCLIVCLFPIKCKICCGRKPQWSKVNPLTWKNDLDTVRNVNTFQWLWVENVSESVFSDGRILGRIHHSSKLLRSQWPRI